MDKMTREEAIHIVNVAFSVPQAIRRSGENRTYFEDEIREAKGMAIKALEQTRWISVSERLPEKEMNCLMTDSLGKVHKATFYHALDGRESYFSGCYCVIAWMPLPEPYKADKE